jgi:SecY interacting protein Syd
MLTDMKSNEAQLANSLTTFHKKFLSNWQQEQGTLPMTEYDSDWLSPCQQGSVDEEGRVAWHYQPADASLSFANVEQALGITLHSDIKDYFSMYYSENLGAKSQDGALELLQVWNKEDFARLQENIIGHILMKQKLKQEITVFFAVTDEEDIILSVNNDSGEVWAERVGQPSHKFIASDLASFLSTLDPYISS